MKKIKVVLLSIFTFSLVTSFLPGVISAPDLQKGQAVDPQIIGPSQQISFVGPRSGEAYFSPDGENIIFQSERHSGNPFYQIYQMNLVNGQTQLLSNGKGKTTCAWYHPSMKKALFSSTHHDPKFAAKVEEELRERANPIQGKYSWSFDNWFDIFEVDLKTKKLKKIHAAPGYDAEASYSPDGQWILFASNRTGYTEKLSTEDQALFEKDPSSQMELYIMRSDGTGVKRLTHHLGYDGGPFFSADGQQITWRRFNRLGSLAEIWVMNADGSNARQLTQWQSMSWAPYFHPSGDYIIFTSNKLGYQNFELFIVATNQPGEPVRVSFQDGFDGLPVFSPDGKKLMWSHRNQKGESQLLWANWDDTKARQALGLKPALPPALSLSANPHAQDAESLVRYFADVKHQGRMTGSSQELALNTELADWFKDLGLEPYFKNNFLQTFDFISSVQLGEKNQFKLVIENQEHLLKLKEDYTPFSYSARLVVNPSSIAFAGYGLVVPATETQSAYNSYQDLEVKDKWVLVLRDIPEDVENSKRIQFNQVSRLHHKALVAKQRGAKGLIVVTGPRYSGTQKLMDLRLDGAGAPAAIPIIQISNEWAQKLLAPSKINLMEWQKVLDRGEMRAVSELQKVTAQAQVDLVDQITQGHNVIGFLPMPGAQKTLVIGAHGDHLGLGNTGSSLATGAQVGQVHYGADDNASGMATVLMLAKYFVAQKKQGQKLPFNLAFAIWSGEEIGLLGSSHFLKNNQRPIYSYLNFDMVGRLRNKLVIQGLASATEWRQMLEPLAVSQKLDMQWQEDPYLPTDAMSFYLAGIPSLSFFTGAHQEYHTPADRPETINYPGIVTVAKAGQALIAGLNHLPKKAQVLTYQKVQGNSSNEGRKFRIFLGTIPDYVQEKVKGVRISGTSKDSPAEKAGLKSGDIIKRVDQVNIDNLYDYVYLLQALKPKQPIKVLIERQSKELELEVTPTLRE